MTIKWVASEVMNQQLETQLEGEWMSAFTITVR